MSNNRLHPATEVALPFLKMGFTAYGGPAAHIAMMEDEFVEKRKWISREHFLDLIGATNLIPGPNSTEVALHLGHERAGPLGMILAGLCFIVPAVLTTLVLAVMYTAYGNVPAISPFLEGIKPAVLVVIAVAAYRLGKKAVTSIKLTAIAGAVVVLNLLGVSEIYSMLIGGFAGAILLGVTTPGTGAAVSLLLASLATPRVAIAATWVVALGAVTDASLPKLAFFFLKVGAILYGSGYVLVAFLEGDLVNNYGWLTQEQLLDAVAIGQFTPGPVLSTAAFIGYLVAGYVGAVVAASAIFFPSFIFVLILNPLIPRMRKSKWTSCFLDAINAAAVALMFIVIVRLGIGTVSSWQPALIFALIAGLYIWRAPSTPLLVVLGAALGYILQLV